MNIANFITLLSIISGLSTILLIQMKLFIPVYVLFPLILLMDKLDGTVARKFNCTSEMGAQLDSLSDALNFGVVIPLLLYYLSNQSMMVGITGIFLGSCAFWRLARFNSEGGHSDYFKGLPTTNAAAYLFIFAGLTRLIPLTSEWWYVISEIVAGFLMLGTFRYHYNSMFTLILYPAVPFSMILLLWF